MKVSLNRLVIGGTLALGGVLGGAANAQVVTQDANGLYRNQSGGVFHSESSAQMDQMINNNMAMSNAMTQVYMNALQQDILTRSRGNQIIKSGRATVRFPMRAWPTDYWMQNTVIDKTMNAEEERRVRFSGIVAQRQKFAQEMKLRGAKWGDMADMMSVLSIIAYEASSGRRVNSAGFRSMTKTWHHDLLRDAMFQARTTESKQLFYEGELLSATYAWYLRNAGDVAGARAQGRKFLAKWWGKNVAAVEASLAYNASKPAAIRTATRTAKAQTAKSSTRYARNPGRKAASKATAKAPVEMPQRTVPIAQINAAATSTKSASTENAAPLPSFAQAVEITSFKRVEDSVLPAKFASQMTDKKTASQLENVTRQLIDGARGDLMQNPKSNLPVDNVARAFNYYVTVLYPVAMSHDGQPLGRGLTRLTLAQNEALRRQFAQRLASNPNFQKMSDREKQEAAEMYLLVPALTGVLYQAGLQKNDVQSQQSARRMARNALTKTFGVAPEKLRFTDSGLRTD